MQTSSLKNKSKRVQKKLYLGDYAILGFEISAKFTQEDETEVDSFFDSFIEFTESLNLCLGVGYSTSSFNGFITSIERYKSPSEDDRIAVEKWLSSQSNISDISVGSLVDANYFFK